MTSNRPRSRPPIALALLLTGLAGSASAAPDWTDLARETGLVQDNTGELALSTSIARATVYPSSALVTRMARVDGPGEYVIEGLPPGLNASSVRVRVPGMQVMRVDVRDRFVKAVPDARLSALQNDRDRVARAIAAVQVDLISADDQVKFYRELLEDGASGEAGEGEPNVEAWREGAIFLGQGYSTALKDKRRVEGELEDLREELRELDAEISRGTGGSGRSVKDAYVSLDGPPNQGGDLELDYLIGGASWAPAYDLRADQAMTKVALSYRADVVQTTGEDWNDIELFLSTANPNVGAQAPTLGAVWLNLFHERARAGLRKLGYVDEDALEFEELGYTDSLGRMTETLQAAVIQNAGSLRYQVARRESIPSRSDTSRVLVGAADLAVTAEHRCVPALDLGVWLRGRATNDSQWELLPGGASIYFGGDFVGRATLGHVRTGEEFSLDLGLDPNITVERVALEDKAGSAGFFGSKDTLQQSWRLRFKATGAAARRADGKVLVLVHEVLPKSRHEDLDVDLDHAVPPVSDKPRFAADRADKGILTWELLVPHMGEATIEWGYELSYPDDMELIR